MHIQSLLILTRSCSDSTETLLCEINCCYYTVYLQLDGKKQGFTLMEINLRPMVKF